ncbi:MAG TPA: hypothetical protein VGJ22_12545 [Anaerolineales bacterium]|jgi:hypothetical protein
MQFFRKHWGTIVVIGLVVAAVCLRLRLYGDLRLAIANNDTASYAAAAANPNCKTA